jgi:hypothetical protein
MLAKVTSCAVVGLDGVLIEVEIDISRGLPSMTIVGLPDAAAQESRERVRAAIKNSGLPFPSDESLLQLVDYLSGHQRLAPYEVNFSLDGNNLPHFPGDGDNHVLREWVHGRARATDCDSRKPANDQTV